MRRVLMTGMSGTGKSSLVAELAALGYKGVDTDAGWCELQSEVLTQRLATRTNNPFGKSAEESRRFQADFHEVEPQLRAVADCEIDTTMVLSDVVRAILKAVGAKPPA